jgi:hypothetical protein
MRLQVTFWNKDYNGVDNTREVEVEFVKHSDYDYVPYGERDEKRSYIEFEVFVYGDIPEEIKNDIKDQFNEDKRFFSGTTSLYEYQAE